MNMLTFHVKQIEVVEPNIPISLYIRLHVCLSVSPSGHLVPGTNSEIEGLTLANSGTNNRKEWD